MGDNVLETRELTKNFSRQFAVNGVSLETKRNTTYGLSGPNGAGKSTILKLILGLLRPTRGEILFDGESWKREYFAKISSLIEEPASYGSLTAEENLLVHIRLLGVPKDKIYEVLETVDLKDTGSRHAPQFSHGMKEQLGTTIALLNDPSLLILDEPISGLDPVGIQKLRELIATLPKKGMAVTFSNHILSEVEQVMDEIDTTNKGQPVFQGTPSRDENLRAFFMEVIKGDTCR